MSVVGLLTPAMSAPPASFPTRGWGRLCGARRERGTKRIVRFGAWPIHTSLRTSPSPLSVGFLVILGSVDWIRRDRRREVAAVWLAAFEDELGRRAEMRDGGRGGRLWSLGFRSYAQRSYRALDHRERDDARGILEV